MGICAEKHLKSEDDQKRIDKKNNKNINSELTRDKAKDALTHKLLLLGAGSSGKSTLFKQMQIIYIKGFPEDVRIGYIKAVHNNVIESIKALCQACDTLGQLSDEYKVADRLVKTKNEILNDIDDNVTITEELGRKILDIWADRGIQKTYENRSRFQLSDSTDYFFNRLAEIALEDYIPTEQDILRTRVPTTGIVEIVFEIEGSFFRMYDVGGQRSERKKWIHSFENVTAVVFVAAISAYDQVLYEDDSVNRMSEALTLFEKISNLEWFENTAMILFLNKSDLLQDKIEHVPLSKFFKDYVYTGIDTKYVEAVDFIVEMFENKCTTSIFTHVTVATDSSNIAHVFKAVKQIVIKKGLEKAGFT